VKNEGDADYSVRMLEIEGAGLQAYTFTFG
jgi:hypothetical protein